MRNFPYRRGWVAHPGALPVTSGAAMIPTLRYGKPVPYNGLVRNCEQYSISIVGEGHRPSRNLSYSEHLVCSYNLMLSYPTLREGQ